MYTLQVGQMMCRENKFCLHYRFGGHHRIGSSMVSQTETGIPWLLYLTDRPDEGAISVSFFIGQGVDFGGGEFDEGTGEQFTKVRVQINLPPDRAANPNDLYVESVILHELGHAMGLGHTAIQD